MGEYEEPYPDAYGRDETEGEPPAPAELYLPPRQHRQSTLFRTRFGGGADEPARTWRHAPAEPPPAVEARAVAGSYRGLGPRGYVRSDQRIYEDICDRLTENPFIDASDISVTVRDRRVVLAGRLDNSIALGQAEEIACEVAGVVEVRSELVVRQAPAEAAAGEPVDRAMPPPADR